MTLNSPSVKNKLAEWQKELRDMTDNDTVLIVSFHPPTLDLTLNDLIEIICEETGVPADKVKVKGRETEVVATRHLIAYYGATFTNLSLKSIGKQLGGRDHSTIIHSRDRVRGLLETSDYETCRWVNRINKRLAERANNMA